MVVPELMSSSRFTESTRRGAISPNASKGLLGKVLRVLFKATVALEIVEMAATIDAPSAKTRAAKRLRLRGRSAKYMLTASDKKSGVQYDGLEKSRNV